MFNRFTEDARRAVTFADEMASRNGHQKITPAHLLIGIVLAGGIGARIATSHGVEAAALEQALTGRAAGPAGLNEDEVAALRAIGVDAEAISRKVTEAFGRGALDDVIRTPSRRPRLRMGDEAKEVLTQALREATVLKHGSIGTEHILLALLAADEPSATLLAGHGLTYEQVRRLVLEEVLKAS
jgi:ATP-dependent Clp protease ATP-binding subunit ClpA